MRTNCRQLHGRGWGSEVRGCLRSPASAAGPHRLVREVREESPLSVVRALKTDVCPWLLGPCLGCEHSSAWAFSRGRRAGALPVSGGEEEGRAGGDFPGGSVQDRCGVSEVWPAVSQRRLQERVF